MDAKVYPEPKEGQEHLDSEVTACLYELTKNIEKARESTDMVVYMEAVASMKLYADKLYDRVQDTTVLETKRKRQVHEW